MRDSYVRPIAGKVWRNEISIKRSRFIALVGQVRDEREARSFIAQARDEFPDAKHHCSAYLYHVDAANPVERSSDDGEPSGTAGRPMLEQLRGSGMLDIAAVVVRYFGGIKLGAGGLVHAYSESVGAVLPDVVSERRRLVQLFDVELDHGEAGRVEAELRALGVDIVDATYDARVTLTMTDPGPAIAALTGGRAEPRESGFRWM